MIESQVKSIFSRSTPPEKRRELETEGEREAVMVDKILGQQQVVIKSMEQNVRKVSGVAGATRNVGGGVKKIVPHIANGAKNDQFTRIQQGPL